MSTAEKIDGIYRGTFTGDEVEIRKSNNGDFYATYPSGRRLRVGNHASDSVYTYLRPLPPTPKPFKVGDRVRTVAKNTAVAPIGTTGTITYDANEYDYPYSVQFDESQNGFSGDLYTAEELELLPVPVPVPIKITYPFKPGDRVVYTIPETHLGYFGTDIAVRPEGTRGVVKSQIDSDGVRVDWEDEGPAATSVAFVAPDVEPTHRHTEGVYASRDRDTRVFVKHDTSRENYLLIYVDAFEIDGNVPVNHNISGAYLTLAYTLVATA